MWTNQYYRFEPFCQGPGCTNTKLIAKGLCWKHYRQQLRHGRLLPLKPDVPPPCQAPGCRQLARSKTGKGYCWRHLAQLRRHGRLLGPQEARTPHRETQPCRASGCPERGVGGTEYCREHQSQIVRQKSLADDRRQDGTCHWRKRRVTEADCRWMAELRGQGKTYYDIADTVGFSVQTVFKQLKKLGVKKTQPKEGK